MEDTFSAEDLRDIWTILSLEERINGFRLLPRDEAEEFFFALPALDQTDVLLGLPKADQRAWMRLLPPDDAADVIQEAPPEEKDRLLGLLDDPARKEVTALLAYAEDAAGGLMNPRFVRLRPSMTVDEAISYLRRQTVEQLYYVYVLDEGQRLLGVISFRELFGVPGSKTVREIMHDDLITVNEEEDQEAVSRLFAQHDLVAIPVVDGENRMKGIVTVDDIVDVVQQEATEDIQKFGGMAALEAPYLDIKFFDMLKKRGGWLVALFLGQMLTASAMTYFQGSMERALVLAMFVPLIISSGGNTGSQGSTLVIRAMALDEVRPRDWWRVMKREIFTGTALGLFLGVLGFFRIVIWQQFSPIYGEHYWLIGLTVMLSLIGVVLLGALAGSLLPFVMKRFGFDPASASGPFVATLVDVTGLILYFTLASLVLHGTLL